MFSLLKSLFYFCKLIARILGGLELFAMLYIDEIAVRYMKGMTEVLQCLLEVGLTVKPTK